MSDLWKLLALENAKREIEWGIINDHLREISGRPDFCVKDLTSECYAYIFVPYPCTIFDTLIICIHRRRGFTG